MKPLLRAVMDLEELEYSLMQVPDCSVTSIERWALADAAAAIRSYLSLRGAGRVPHLSEIGRKS